MPNSSKIAFIFHGEAKAHSTATPLEHLGDDVKKMKTILTPLWDVKKEGLLERSFFSKDSLSSYKAEELDVLFYFTGHGIDYQDGKSIEYSLMLSHDNKQNSTIKELVEDLMTHLSPKTLTIVLDACYSGQATIETDSNKDIQLLSSSNYTQESYESWGVGGGIFTHFFCQAIEGTCGKDTTGKITLGDIADNIREPLKNQRQNIVEKTINLGELSNLAIAYNREVLEIKNILKEKFSTKEFKSKLFEFLDKDNLGFQKILSTENFDELLLLALKHNKPSLSCIFKEFGLEHGYLGEFSELGCMELRNKADGNLDVKKIIVRITSNNGKSNDCTLKGWLQNSIDTLDSLATQNIDFTSDYISVLAKYIKEPLVNKNLAYNPLELDLILDDMLMAYDFYPLGCEIYRFKITIQLLNREKKVMTVWEKNSAFFETKQLEKIKDYLFHINEVYEKTDIEHCFSDKKILIDSSHNLLTTRYIEMIKNLGLPFVITPASDIVTKVDFEWKNESLESLRLKGTGSLMKHYNRVNYYEKDEELETLNEEKTIQFIYDNYHDSIKLKALLQEINETIK